MEPSIKGGFMPSRVSSLSSFSFLWAATGVSNLSDGIFKFGLPLLATHLTDSPCLVPQIAECEG